MQIVIALSGSGSQKTTTFKCLSFWLWLKEDERTSLFVQGFKSPLRLNFEGVSHKSQTYENSAFSQNKISYCSNPWTARHKTKRRFILRCIMNKKITLKEIFEKDKELDEGDFQSLKHWYSKQDHLPPISDELLALFLCSCEHNVELGKVTVDNYFTVRSHTPEFFDNRNPFAVNIKNGRQIGHFALLNKRTPDGCRIILTKLANLDPSDFVFSEQVKAFHMLLDLELYLHGPIPGLVVVFDMDGVTFGHIGKLNVVHIKKILYYVQEAMPTRLKGLHYINAIAFMDIIKGLIKPFMKKNLLEVLHIHAHGMEDFYKFVPKEILPSDYGGEDFSVEELHEKSLKILQDHKGWFEAESKQRVDESKRTGKSKSSELFGMDGSFKKLNLD